MEIELKWQSNKQMQEDIEKFCTPYSSHVRTINMNAIYYDSDDNVLSKNKIGLRIRQENNDSVCCLKFGGGVSGATHSRQEFECRTQDISDGLAKLKTFDIPTYVYDTLNQIEVSPICQTKFTRIAHEILYNDMTAELALDCGELIRNCNNIPLCEIELEYKNGSMETFNSFATMLSQKFNLKAENKSKLVRALAIRVSKK